MFGKGDPLCLIPYAEPLWHDPTDVLASRAAERRVGRIQSACEAR